MLFIAMDAIFSNSGSLARKWELLSHEAEACLYSWKLYNEMIHPRRGMYTEDRESRKSEHFYSSRILKHLPY